MNNRSKNTSNPDLQASPRPSQQGEAEPDNSKPNTWKKGKKSRGCGGKPGSKRDKPSKPKFTCRGANSSELSPTTRKFFESLEVALSSELTQFEMFVSTCAYMELVEIYYAQCCLAHPGISSIFTVNMLGYACALWFSARIESVRLNALEARLPKAKRSPVPKDIRLPMVFADALAVIGRVEIQETRTVYLPKTALPNAKASAKWDDEFETRLAEDVAFDWETLAKNAIADIDTIEQRLARQQEVRKVQPQKVQPQKVEKADLAKIGRNLVYIKAVRRSDENARAMKEDDFEYEDLAACRKALREAKHLMESFVPEPVPEPILPEASPATPSVSQAGEFLGFDSRIWFHYERFRTCMEDFTLFSPSGNNDVEGMEAMILPIKQLAGGQMSYAQPFRAVGPHAGIAPINYVLSIVLRFARWYDVALGSGPVTYWAVYSNTFTSVDRLRIPWVQKTFKTTSYPNSIKMYAPVSDDETLRDNIEMTIPSAVIWDHRCTDSTRPGIHYIANRLVISLTNPTMCL